MSEMRGLCGPGTSRPSRFSYLACVRASSVLICALALRTDCTGLDTAFVLSGPGGEVEKDVVMRLQSRASGVRCVPAVLRIPLRAVVAAMRRDC
jgi:hypothetical protein